MSIFGALRKKRSATPFCTAVVPAAGSSTRMEGQDKLLLELGVGRMTPMFIQEPFWNLTYNLPRSFYATINPRDALVPREIADRSLAIHDDIARVLSDIVHDGEAAS